MPSRDVLGRMFPAKLVDFCTERALIWVVVRAPPPVERPVLGASDAVGSDKSPETGARSLSDILMLLPPSLCVGVGVADNDKPGESLGLLERKKPVWLAERRIGEPRP